MGDWENGKIGKLRDGVIGRMGDGEIFLSLSHSILAYIRIYQGII